MDSENVERALPHSHLQLSREVTEGLRAFARGLKESYAPFQHALKQMELTQKAMQKPLQPLQKAYRDISVSLEGIQGIRLKLPVTARADSLQKQFGDIAKALGKLQKGLPPQKPVWARPLIPEVELSGLRALRDQIASIGKSLASIYEPLVEAARRSCIELPPKIEEALLILAEHNWYLDLDMPIPALWEIRDRLSSGDIAQVESELVEYFDGRTDEIEKALVDSFAHRAHIIQSAFAAHRREEYELSIPVLLAQTDGLCKEIADHYLFMKRDKRPTTASFVENAASTEYTAALLTILAEPTVIGASEAERPEGFRQLNRHTVLHGESLDYGTKVNSIKAISLINHVSQALRMVTRLQSKAECYEAPQDSAVSTIARISNS